MNRFAAVAWVLALATALSSCDSPAENRAEHQADATASAMEAKAESLNDAGMISDKQEDVLVDKADAQRDAKKEAIDQADPGSAN